MAKQRAHIIAVAGPNGAGKSTTAPSLLKGTLKVKEFVNADLIALDNPGISDIGAGRVMLNRMRYLSQKGVDFAFESTISSRSFAPWISMLCKTDYLFHLVFLWLPSEKFAINRVAERVKMGGHNVPEKIVKRRYQAGLNNFFKLYQPIADTWYFYDNSIDVPSLLAYGKKSNELVVKNEAFWHNITTRYG